MLQTTSGVLLGWAWKPKKLKYDKQGMLHKIALDEKPCLRRRLKQSGGKRLESQFVLLPNGEADYKTLTVCKNNSMYGLDSVGCLYKRSYDKNLVFKFWEKVEEYEGVKW